MGSRHREDTVDASAEDWAMVARYTTTYGTCLVDACPPWTIWTVQNKSGNSQVTLHTREMDDVVTPDFYTQSAKGKIVNSPMTSTIVKLSVPILSMNLTYDTYMNGCTPKRDYLWRMQEFTGTYSIEGIVSANDLFLPPSAGALDDIEDMVDSANTTAHARIGHEEILSLSAVKELGQTVGGLAYILKKVLRISRAVRKREIKTLRHEMSYKELEEVYMNARYNLRPLAYDVKGILSILRGDGHKPGRHTFRAGSQAQVSNSDTLSKPIWVHGATLCRVDSTVHRSCNVAINVRAGVLTNSDQVHASQLWGLDSIVESAWDLIPYSFIVDWFWNVGDTIMSFTPVYGVKKLASWVVKEITTTQTTTLEIHPPTSVDSSGYLIRNKALAVSGSLVASKVTTTKQRISDHSLSVFPTWNPKLDGLKLLDLGIIISNLRKYRSVAM